MILDVFGPLPKIKASIISMLVLMSRLLRRVELIVFKRAEVTDVVSALRCIWMPKHGVPAVSVSENGTQFTANIVQ